MALDQKYLYPFFGPVAVDLKPLNYLPWGARPKKTVQHNFGLAPFGPKIFGLKTFGAEKFGLAVPSPCGGLGGGGGIHSELGGGRRGHHR